MAVQLIERKLNEDYSSNFPRWLVNKLNRNYSLKDYFLKKNIDLNKATFTKSSPPTSSRDSVLNDNNMVPIFLLNDGTVYSPMISSTGDRYFSYIDNKGNKQFKSLHSTPWRYILSSADDFGYIDVSNATNLNKDLRSQRKASKSGVVDRHSNAQYKKPVYGDKKDRYGYISREDDNIAGYQWLTRSGYDKSGYPLDPEKYVRMLNSISLDNYAQKLNRYYKLIKKAQSDLSKAVTGADVDNAKYRSSSSSWNKNPMDDIEAAATRLSRAISEYRQLQRYIDQIVNSKDLSDEDKSDYLSRSWGPSGKTIYDNIKEADEYIKSVLTNDSYPDD